MEAIDNLRIRFEKKQFCPTLQDLENEELRELAKKLEGDSEKKTLTNILEWQHKNINYWIERGILDVLWIMLTPIYLLLSSVVALFISIFFYLIALPLLGYNWSLYLGVTIFVLFLLWSLLQDTIMRVILALLFSFPAFLIIKFSILKSISNVSFIDSGLTFVLLNGILFGAALLTTIYLIFSYLPILRGETKKSKIQKLIQILSDTFQINLSVKRILNYRLAICRDYAKLTASILFTINPDLELYFILIPRHVAAAINVNDVYYVLDQHLPVMTLDRWLVNWNQKKAEILISKISRYPDGIPKSVDLNLHKKVGGKLESKNSEVDAEKLASEVAKSLGIKQSSNKTVPEFEIPLKNFGIYYCDNDITRYSLIRAIKNKIENELCSNISKISEIRIYKKNKDLIVAVCI
jgi:predicted transglutaminase-like protease